MPKETKIITLEELTNGIENYNKLQTANRDIEQFIIKGNRLAFLLYNQADSEDATEAIVEWRKLVQSKTEC